MAVANIQEYPLRSIVDNTYGYNQNALYHPMIGMVVGTQGSGPVTSSYVHGGEPITTIRSLDYNTNSLWSIDADPYLRRGYSHHLDVNEPVAPLTDTWQNPLNEVRKQEEEHHTKKWLYVSIAGAAVAFAVFIWYMVRHSKHKK